MKVLQIILLMTFRNNPDLERALKNNIERLFPEVNVRITNTYSNYSSGLFPTGAQYIEHMQRVYGDYQNRIILIHQEPMVDEKGLELKGYSQIGRFGVVTTAYFKDEPELLIGRTVKVVLHELAHTFNVGHCEHPRCVLNVGDLKLSHLDSTEYFIHPEHFVAITNYRKAMEERGWR